jgi:hydrogenase nickel incorporation protein HypB
MEIKVLQRILKANDGIARENRRYLTEKGIFSLNLMSSPGAGKTSILERTIERLRERLRLGVIEGDIATSRDAERIGRLGVPVLQINTDMIGGACHLDANMIQNALREWEPGEVEALDMLIVENVGNLVCPAEFDIGTDMSAMVLSVAEGDDKPKKYPLMFTISEVLLLNKMDLIEHTDFDMERFRKDVADVNPRIRIFPLSAKTGEGLEAWCDWLVKRQEG